MRDIAFLEQQRANVKRQLDALNQQLSELNWRDGSPTDSPSASMRQNLEQQLAQLSQQIPELRYLTQFIRFHNIYPGHPARQSLRDLYIEPNLDDHGTTPVSQALPAQPSMLAEILAEEPHIHPSSYSDLLNDVLDMSETSSVFITGEAGIGKTTLLKMIGVHCAERVLQDEQTPVRLPVYVELRRFGHHLLSTRGWGQLSDLAEYIALECRVWFPNYTVEDVQHGLNTGKYLLLLDALDEIAVPALRVRVMKSIHEALHFSQCPLVITMRSATYHQTKAYSHYTSKELRRLTIEQIRKYVNQWFDNQPTTPAKSLLEELERNQRLRQLLSNPLLLYMMVRRLSSQATGATLDIPGDRVQLYKSFIDHLLQDRPFHRFEQAIEERPLLGTPLKQHEYLCLIAYEMHELALWYAPEAMIRSIIARVPPCPAPDEAQGHLHYLEEETGMLQRRPPDYYAFSHFTFQEFFTAEYLANRARASHGTSAMHLFEETSFAVLMDPWWHEVIVIYYALSYDDQLIKRLLVGDDNIFATHLLLAVDCIIASSARPMPGRVAQIHERLVEIYRTSPYALLRQRAFTEIERLGDQNQLLLRFLADELRQTDRERCERAITALGRIGTPEAVRLLVNHYRREGFPRGLMLHAITALVTDAPSDAVPTILDMLSSDQNVAAQIINQMLAADQPEYTRLLLIFLTDDAHTAPWLFDMLLSQLGPRQDQAVRSYLLDVLRAAHAVDDVPRIVQVLDVIDAQPAGKGDVDAGEPVPYVRSLLTSDDVRLVIAALHFLGRQGDQSVVDELFELLLQQDQNTALQAEVLRTLAAIGGTTAELMIIEFIKENPAPSLRQEGMVLLGHCGKEVSLTYLGEQLTAVMAGGRSNSVLPGVIIQALASIRRHQVEVPYQHVCKLVLQYLQRDDDVDEIVAEAATLLVLEMGGDDQIAQLLNLVRKRKDLAYALMMYLLAKECPARARIPVRTLVDEYVGGRLAPELIGPAFRLKLRLLEEPEERIEAVRSALDSRSNPAVYLEALTSLRLEMVPDADMLSKVRGLLENANALVVERALEVLAEFGTDEDIQVIHPLLYQSEFKQQAYDTLFAIAQRDRLLGRAEFRR